MSTRTGQVHRIKAGRRDGTCFASIRTLSRTDTLDVCIPGKGIERLIEAFDALAEDLPAARLVFICGYHSVQAWFRDDNYEEQVASALARARYSDRISFSGEFPADGPDASHMLRAIDVAVLPIDRGVGLLNSSLTACMAHGLPTIATRGSRVDAPLTDGANLLFVSPDVNDLREAMLRLEADTALRSHLARGASALAEKPVPGTRLRIGLWRSRLILNAFGGRAASDDSPQYSYGKQCASPVDPARQGRGVPHPACYNCPCGNALCRCLDWRWKSEMRREISAKIT